DHPLKNMVDRGIFDNGCSGHMTGNKDQLEDFEEFNGGSVTFGGSKGYISGKGKIRVGNLDFDSVSLVQGLVTPSKTTVNTSGEEQAKDISPTTLETAKTLSRVASQKPKSIDKGRRYKRRKETKGKKIVSSLNFQEEVSTGAEGVNTAKGVNTGSIKVSTVSRQVITDSINKSIPSPDKGQREGKAPKKTKEQILQEEASLAEAIRLDTL
ncbi:hypothetical protein Tco_0193182, partial [Tanacetum coccineum]